MLLTVSAKGMAVGLDPSHAAVAPCALQGLSRDLLAAAFLSPAAFQQMMLRASIFEIKT